MGSLFDDDDNEDLDTMADTAVEKEEGSASAPAAEAEEITPRNNPDFLGHADVEQALLRDCLGGRLPHALVLAGPAGIGKATLAFRLARFLFAQAPQEAGLFGEAPAPSNLFVSPSNAVFRRVASSGHADLLTIEREFDEKKGRFKNDIPVDTVRRIPPFLRMTSAENGWRAVILDGAEYLNASGQNALLKIVEEPPSRTILMLTTSQPGGLLPTIRSRCRTIHLEALEDKTVGNLLDRYVPSLKADEKATLVRLAEGSIGRALQFHRDGGVALYKQLLDVLATLPSLDMVKVHDLAEKIGRAGGEIAYATACDIILGWCSRVARMSARGQPLTDVVAGDAAIFNRISAAYPAGHFLRAWEKTSELFRQTDIYNLDKRQAVIGAFLALQRPEYQGLAL